jgi:hypothetical protein
MSLVGKTSFTVSANGMNVPVTGVRWNGNQFSGNGSFMGQSFSGSGTASGNTVSGMLRRFVFYSFPHAICPSFCILGKSVCLHELSHFFRESVQGCHHSMHQLQWNCSVDVATPHPMCCSKSFCCYFASFTRRSIGARVVF